MITNKKYFFLLFRSFTFRFYSGMVGNYGQMTNSQPSGRLIKILNFIFFLIPALLFKYESDKCFSATVNHDWLRSTIPAVSHTWKTLVQASLLMSEVG